MSNPGCFRRLDCGNSRAYSDEHKTMRGTGRTSRRLPGKSVEGGAMTINRSVTLALVLSALSVMALAGAAGALEVGQKAPDFALNGIDGKPVKLSDLTAKGPVVIYTFIAAFTPT